MADKKEALNIAEQKSVMSAIYELIKKYPNLKGLEVKFEEFKENGSSLAIFSDSGAYIDKKYITGAFTGIVPFSIVYRAAPNQDKHKINMIEYLENLAVWLNEEEYPDMTENRTLLSIEATTVAFKDMSNQAGDNDYAILLNATYRKE